MKFLNRIVLSIFFVFLILIPASFASYPDYNVDYVLKNNVGMNSSMVGTIIIDKTNYISKTYNLTNFTGVTIQRYDEIRSNFSEYVKINSSNTFLTGLQAGETYKFSTAGTYKLYKSNNASDFFNIVVTGEDALKVKLNISSDKISFNYNKDEQTIDTQYVYNFTATLNSSIEPGSYPFNITVITNELNKSANKTLVVDEYETWTLMNNTLGNMNLSSDTYKSVGVITLNNTGNKNYNIRVNITGNGSNYINYPSSIATYKGMPVYISFLAQVPSSQNDGLYPIVVNIVSNNQTMSIPINLTIKDTIPPLITNITLDDYEVIKPFNINLTAKDNVQMDYVDIKIDDLNTTNMSKDQQMFHYENSVNTTGLHRFVFCAHDISQNINCINSTYDFKQMDIAEYNTTAFFYSTKYGKYSAYRIMIINYTLPAPITVSLKSFFTDEFNITDYYNNTDIRIIDGDGSKYSFKDMNSTVKISKPGEIFLEVRKPMNISYDGTLSFNVSPLMKPINDINFKGKFIDYDLPKSFVMPWFWNLSLTVDVEDTGYFETSKYIIREFTIPIGANLKDLALPTTIAEKKYADDELQSWKDKYKNAMILYIILIAICLGVLSGLIFLTYYFAVIRHRMVYLRESVAEMVEEKRK